MLIPPQTIASNSSCDCVVSSCPSSPQEEIDENLYEYLIVIDFEATCDNGHTPSISLTLNNQEMIEFPFVVIKLLNSSEVDWTVENPQFLQIIHSEQHYVKPEYSTNLTRFCTELTGISDDTISQHGQPLRKVLSKFDMYIDQHMKDKRWILISDGEWDLKQLLIRESKNKQIPLLQHYYKFFDMRKEYKKCFPNAHIRGLSSMVEHAGIDFIGKHHCGLDDCLTLVKLINVLLQNGHRFKDPCIIDEYYDPFRDFSFTNFRQSSPPPANVFMPVYYNDTHVYHSYQHCSYSYNAWSYPPLVKTKAKKSKKKRAWKSTSNIARGIAVNGRQ